MDNFSPNHQDLARIQFLRRMVTVLTTVTICCTVIITTVIVLHFFRSPITIPSHITLPNDTLPSNVTISPNWIGVLTNENLFLIFDRITGELEQTITIQ
ncbi:MAG: DUF6476 family protein [Aestuariivita sp.]|nr:DUF6476 family protein [Aestuariivita sp.]